MVLFEGVSSLIWEYKLLLNGVILFMIRVFLESRCLLFQVNLRVDDGNILSIVSIDG
jgi:hypothetical protein